MNKKSLLLLGISAVLTANAQSPITLTNSDMPGSGDTLRYSNAQMSSVGNYTQTGTNYAWNFSSLVPTGQGVRSFKNALSTPYAFFFFGLNEYGEKIADTLGAGPIKLTNYYNYYKKQSSPSAYIADGAGITFSSVPVPNYYSDKDELYKFPMSYPKYDSTTFKFSTTSNSLIPIQYSKTGYRVTIVDGWGTVTTPFGTANCLRLITTQYSQDSIKNIIVPFPIGFPNNQRSYQWMVSGGKIPFLEINGALTGSSFNPTQARYRDSSRTIVGIKEIQTDKDLVIMYPNPVKDKLSLKFNKNLSYELAIADIAGKELIKEKVEANSMSNSIDVSALKPGIYLLRVRQEGAFYTIKFIKE